jgi:hypothetical protein
LRIQFLTENSLETLFSIQEPESPVTHLQILEYFTVLQSQGVGDEGDDFSREIVSGGYL